MMNSQDDKEGSGHVKAAIIGGVFALLAACVGGFFLLLNTMVNNGVIVFGASNPSVPPTATVYQYQAPPSEPTVFVQPIATLTSLPSVPFQPTIASSSSLCPDYVSRSKVQSWSIGATDVATVDDKAREFNASRSYPRGNFKAGDTIPAGVVVATAFDGAGRKWSEFPVTPLVHHGDYGLFETLGEYIAPYEGACISIAP